MEVENFLAEIAQKLRRGHPAGTKAGRHPDSKFLLISGMELYGTQQAPILMIEDLEPYGTQQALMIFY